MDIILVPRCIDCGRVVKSGIRYCRNAHWLCLDCAEARLSGHDGGKIPFICPVCGEQNNDFFSGLPEANSIGGYDDRREQRDG